VTKHLTETEAADLARDVAAPGSRRWMERHLAEGCARCRRAVMLFQRVAETARADASWDVPADVIERAVDIFSLRPVQVTRPVHRLLARLVFDSFREPLPVGVRSTRSVSRQVLYRAGSYFIDLRLDATAATRRVSLVGQVVRRGAIRASTRMASVALVDGRTVLSHAPVNSFGEFQVDYDSKARVRLRVLLDAGRTAVDLPLSRLLRDRET
jgi:hypothetical protein